MIEIEVNGTRARCVSGGEMLTSGCVGLVVKVAFSPEWRGLIKTAIVCGSGKNLETSVGLDDTFIVPHECITEAESEVKIGLYGMRKDGAVVIPTVYCALGIIQAGTVPTGENGEEPTPSVFNQLIAVAAEAVDAAQTAQAAAESAQNKTSASAEEAAASAEMAEKANASATAQAETATAAAQAAMASEAAAQAAAVDAKVSEQAARQYSQSAGDSAAAAEKSASSIQTSESTAAASETAAVKAASEAKASASAAASSASAAAASATTAETDSGIAAMAATNAKAAAQSAQESQAAAQAGAEQASASATTATTAANTAENAATSAASSAEEASASAANAQASETAAAGSASAAAQSATLASAYKYDPNTYKGVDLTVKFADEIAKYSDEWAWIQARIKAANYTDLHVKDYIPVKTTNGVSLTAQIAGFDTYYQYGDSGVKHHIDFICEELWPTLHVFNKVNFNNGISATVAYPWLASDLYHFVNSLSGTVPNTVAVGGGDGEAVDYTADGIYYYLPEALKAVLVQKRLLLPKRYSASGLLTDDNSFSWTNIGYLWVPTEWEVYGGFVWSTPRSGQSGTAVQYPLFAGNMKRRKKCRGTGKDWWLLSAVTGSNARITHVGASGYADYHDASLSTIAVPVCFRVS